MRNALCLLPLVLAACAQLAPEPTPAPAPETSARPAAAAPAAVTGDHRKALQTCKTENEALKASLAEAEAKIRALTSLEHKMEKPQ